MRNVIGMAVGLVILGTACGSSEDYINLDGVFDAFILTAKGMESKMPPPPAPAPVATPAEGTDGKPAADAKPAADGTPVKAPPAMPAKPAEPTVDEKVVADPKLESMFLATFASNLNKRFLATFASNLNKSSTTIGYGKPLGVAFEADGSFLGFEDPNKNNKKDKGEKDVFKLEIDWGKERLVATDLQHTGYHRDHTYRRSGMGFFGGYMVGRMLGGQTRAGLSPSRFSKMPMKPKGYHKAVPGAKRYGKSSSARSSGGSRGYRGGK